MKNKIKSIGIDMSCRSISILEDICAFCPLFIHKILILIHTQTPFYFLFGLFYNNSDQERRDAEDQAFGDDWKCYTPNQIKMMEQMGYISVIRG